MDALKLPVGVQLHPCTLALCWRHYFDPFWSYSSYLFLPFSASSPLPCHPLCILCSTHHPPPLRVGWSPFCCPSCVWSWSSTPGGAGVNAVASLSPRRAPVRRRLMRSTTSPQCWWEDRPARAWGTRAVKAPIPAAPWVFERHPFWTGT